MQDAQPRLLFAKDLKRMFPGLGSDSIYALLNNGAIPARKIGNKWVTTPAAVDEWLQRIGSGPGDSPTLKVVR
ncbi:MAG: helix-turn-helix domain-containing protein [Actinobacteria bacterium]|nr:helix-turn-helix domain-containing protein [Actinomycetota bacterium]